MCVCFLTRLIIVDEQQKSKDSRGEKKDRSFLSLVVVMVGDALNFCFFFCFF